MTPSKRRISKLVARADYLEAKGLVDEAKAARDKVSAISVGIYRLCVQGVAWWW